MSRGFLTLSSGLSGPGGVGDSEGDQLSSPKQKSESFSFRNKQTVNPTKTRFTAFAPCQLGRELGTENLDMGVCLFAIVRNILSPLGALSVDEVQLWRVVGVYTRSSVALDGPLEL